MVNILFLVRVLLTLLPHLMIALLRVFVSLHKCYRQYRVVSDILGPTSVITNSLRMQSHAMFAKAI